MSQPNRHIWELLSSVYRWETKPWSAMFPRVYLIHWCRKYSKCDHSKFWWETLFKIVIICTCSFRLQTRIFDSLIFKQKFTLNLVTLIYTKFVKDKCAKFESKNYLLKLSDLWKIEMILRTLDVSMVKLIWLFKLKKFVLMISIQLFVVREYNYGHVWRANMLIFDWFWFQ